MRWTRSWPRPRPPAAGWCFRYPPERICVRARPRNPLAGTVLEPRKAYLRALRDGDDLIDRALVFWFEEGHSFTGEEVAELHLHGAPVISNRLSQALLARTWIAAG